MVQRGRHSFVAAALSPAGELVGFSDLRINELDTRKADVGATLVLPGHRGHGLGLAMKLSTHRALLAAYPACELVTAGNAGANAHMNRVNEELGYRVVEELVEMQRRLPLAGCSVSTGARR